MQEIIEKIKTEFSSQLFNIVENLGIINAEIQNKELLTAILKKLESEFEFQVLTDIFGVDDLKHEKRFTVIYNLLSFQKNLRICLKLRVAENETVPTATTVFKGADWYEREIFDMYGVVFNEHPDLRRILTDYGFQGHPLRKDFPLTGYVEVRYDDEKKKVVYEPLNLTQEFRSFDYESPWQGYDKILPGDEKTVKNEESS